MLSPHAKIALIYFFVAARNNNIDSHCATALAPAVTALSALKHLELQYVTSKFYSFQKLQFHLFTVFLSVVWRGLSLLLMRFYSKIVLC